MMACNVMGGRTLGIFFVVDTATIVEFDRNDPNVVPSVNLRPKI